MRRIAKRYVRPDSLPKERLPPEDHDAPGPPATPARLALYSDYRRGPWTYLGCMITLSAGAYVLLLGVGAVGLAAMRGDLQVMAADSDFLAMVIWQLILVAFAAVAAMGYVGATCLFVLPVLAKTRAVLRLPARWETIGAFAGGLVAFLAFLPVVLLNQDAAPPMGQPVGVLLVGPALATFLLQCGGAYAGILNERLACGPGCGGPEKPNRWSFSLRQLFLLTFVASLALAGLSLVGLLTPTLIALVGGWAIWQTLTFYPARRFARWRRRVQDRRFRGTLESMKAERDAALAEFHQRRSGLPVSRETSNR